MSNQQSCAQTEFAYSLSDFGYNPNTYTLSKDSILNDQVKAYESTRQLQQSIADKINQKAGFFNQMSDIFKPLSQTLTSNTTTTNNSLLSELGKLVKSDIHLEEVKTPSIKTETSSLPLHITQDTKLKLSIEATKSYADAIVNNPDSIFGFCFTGVDLDPTNLKLKIEAGEKPTFRFGLSELFKERNLQYTSYVIGVIVSKDDVFNMKASKGDKSLVYDFSWVELQNFFNLCTQNIIVDELKTKYITLLEFCVSSELEHLEQLAPSMDELLAEFTANSVKFKEWVLPNLQIIRRSTRDRKQTDFYTPSKPVDSFKTPETSPISDDEDYTLSPEGKKVLEEHLKNNPDQSKKVVKKELIAIGKEKDPTLIMAKAPKKKGKGLRNKSVVIFKNKDDKRYNRLKVLLGSKKVGNTNCVTEYKSILDTLLKDNTIDKNKYQKLISLIY